MKRLRFVILTTGWLLLAQSAQGDWTPAKRLTWSPGGSFRSALAVDPSGNLHVVWQDNTPGNHEIYYKRSTDGGATWSASQRLTWTTGGSLEPIIAVDSSANLHVVWYDETAGQSEVYYKQSTDGGATWSTSQRLTWSSGKSSVPVITVDSSGHLHLVWYEEVPSLGEIYYKRSTDGGSSWPTSQRLTWTSADSYRPTIAVDPTGNLHLVWYEWMPGYPEIYYKKSSDGGATWTTSQRLTWTSGNSFWPVVAAASSGGLHVVWEDYTPGNPEIYYKRSSDGGTTWLTSQRLTWNLGESEWPVIAVDSSDNLHIAWFDWTPGIPEIYHRKSTDGGDTWTGSQRLTWTPGSSRHPAIAADALGNIHVVWEDNPTGNFEIYYKNGK